MITPRDYKFKLTLGRSKSKSSFCNGYWRILVICLLVIQAASNISSVRASESVRIAVGEWEPYFSESVPNYGSFAEVVTLAFAREGIESTFGFFPWKRAFLLTKSGKWDASAGWAKTVERTPFFHFCDPVIIQREVPFYSTDNPLDLSAMSEANGLRIGALLGAALGDQIDQLLAEKKLVVSRLPTMEDLFHMLAKNRVDFILANEEAAKHVIENFIARKDQHKFQPREDLAVIWDYRVMISKKNQNGEQLCQAFNKGLRSVRETGDYDRIMGEKIK